jgi:hypothetical protein
MVFGSVAAVALVGFLILHRPQHEQAVGVRVRLRRLHGGHAQLHRLELIDRDHRFGLACSRSSASIASSPAAEPGGMRWVLARELSHLKVGSNPTDGEQRPSLRHPVQRSRSSPCRARQALAPGPQRRSHEGRTAITTAAEGEDREHGGRQRRDQLERLGAAWAPIVGPPQPPSPAATRRNRPDHDHEHRRAQERRRA